MATVELILQFGSSLHHQKTNPWMTDLRNEVQISVQACTEQAASLSTLAHDLINRSLTCISRYRRLSPVLLLTPVSTELRCFVCFCFSQTEDKDVKENKKQCRIFCTLH